jgi:hypothetical protein
VLASRLLSHRQWRRLIPYVLPLFFVFLSQFIIFHLDRNYEKLAASPQMTQMKSKIAARYDATRAVDENTGDPTGDQRR